LVALLVLTRSPPSSLASTDHSGSQVKMFRSAITGAAVSMRLVRMIFVRILIILPPP
jgi:hypothetical protein